ncbi:MAG: FimV/HubP family polar landmark protein, partial [Pseudomonadales bacterium]
MAASQTWGLGLGEIEVDSALNEKLNAEIELIDASGLQPAEILVSLASNEDFKRVGVERLFQLTDLSFEVTYGSRGIATIAVTSSRPITEPYLNFLVEVLWPSGRLLKEYTLLLDPPTFSPAPAPAVSAPRRSEAPSQSAGRVARPEPARPATQVQIAPKPQESAPRSHPQSELMTGRNDTLWVIASNTLPTSAATVQQKMLAIQRLNERAFINNNINLLKAGYLLRLPSESEARTLSEREAVAMVATQHDATGAHEARESEVASSSGELRIVAGSGESATGTAQASDGDLNSALEETDRLGREVDELTYQLDREQELAGNQLEVKDRQLAVQDQQIAELQPQIAQLQQQISEQPQNQNQSALAPASGGPWWQSPYMLGGVAGVLVLALVGGLIAARRNREASDE